MHACALAHGDPTDPIKDVCDADGAGAGGSAPDSTLPQAKAKVPIVSSNEHLRMLHDQSKGHATDHGLRRCASMESWKAR